SDKLEKRPMLLEEQVNKNIANYKEQVGKIIDIKRAEFRFNGDWLSKLTLKETANLAESFSVGQMLRRRNFSERFKKDEEISVREFLYPLMQGYDSVAVKADVELGGFDQLFNLHAGRVIQRYYGQKEQDIMTCAMLEGTDGRKMSTSWGNVINISDEPNDMFGKIMSIRDELISKYFLLCTDVEEAEIRKIVSNIKSKKLNPRDAKLRLAKEIVFIYHGGKAAQKAEENFMSLFSKKDMTVDIPTLEIKNHEKIAVANLPIITKVTASRSEARRLVEQGGLQINEVTKSGSKELVSLKSGDILKIGKRHFFRIIVKK
ncbi:MAG: tyrosine--tRNA ligase, partial [Candidatus Colwellbacteria bacterium]|nr:tyrosine--tRNA ligase [Candidatus Colwellbacteria bacterium]